MIIKEFPNVHVDIKHRGHQNPFYAGALDLLGAGEISLLLLRTLPAGVEKTGKFLGATIDLYANGARMITPETRFSNGQLLTTLIEEFAERGLVYGIVLDNEKTPNKTERMLKNQMEMRDFLQEDFLRYNPQRVARTIFVPTERFTGCTWGFSYKPEDLEIMVDYLKKPTSFLLFDPTSNYR